MRRLGSHTGLKAIVEQTYEALVGLQPATCSPSDGTVAAAAGTVLENVRLAAAQLDSAAGDAASQQEGNAAGSTLTKAEQNQSSSAAAAGRQEAQDSNTLGSPSAPSKAVPELDPVGADSLLQLSRNEAAVLLDLDLALLQRLVRSDSAASRAADIRRVLRGIVDPSGEPVSPADICLPGCICDNVSRCFRSDCIGLECLLHFAGPLREAPDSWVAALATLRAACPAPDDVEVRQLLVDTVLAAGQTHDTVAAAISELDDMIAQSQRTRPQQPGDTRLELAALSSLLVAKTHHTSAKVRTASLRCVQTLAGGQLNAAHLAAMTLAARSRLADTDPHAADAAAELLAAVAVRAALLAATGVNIGGMQDEPLWRSQVGAQSSYARSGYIYHASIDWSNGITQINVLTDSTEHAYMCCKLRKHKTCLAEDGSLCTT